VDHFVKKFCTENSKPLCRVPGEVLKLLLDYDWPGNVRELENEIERAVVLATSPELSRDVIRESLVSPGSRLHPDEIAAFNGQTLFEIMDSFERRVIIQMLENVNWSQTEAADRFGVPLSTLNSKVKRLGIDIKRKAAR
jgi:DNA-binding NtrC family response regulator